MLRNWQDWTVVLALVGMASLAPTLQLSATPEPVRIECDTYNVHWDCFEDDGGHCRNHCPSGTAGCWAM
jgi:hypothetical protein